mgnify:FL=1
MPKPRVLAVHDSVVLMVDMQTGLLPAVANSEKLISRTHRLLSGARALGVPVLATEHCSEKIGNTDPRLALVTDLVIEKVYFDATRELDFQRQLPVGRPNILVLGAEAHVCVLQTALGLASAGYTPWLVTDCTGSRFDSDRDAAIQRWLAVGGNVLSSEMALFEWLVSPAHPAFSEVLGLVKRDPDAPIEHVEPFPTSSSA